MYYIFDCITVLCMQSKAGVSHDKEATELTKKLNLQLALKKYSPKLNVGKTSNSLQHSCLCDCLQSYTVEWPPFQEWSNVMVLLTLSTWMSSAHDRPKLSNFVQNFSKFIYLFIYLLWIQYEKCIQMSTNKPSIGAVVLEIAPWTLRKLLRINFSFTNM